MGDYAFYLVHSMSAERNFAAAEENMAQVFADCAEKTKLRQIVYLGGLGEDDLETLCVFKVDIMLEEFWQVVQPGY